MGGQVRISPRMIRHLVESTGLRETIEDPAEKCKLQAFRLTSDFEASEGLPRIASVPPA